MKKISVRGEELPATELRVGNIRARVWPPELAPKLKILLELGRISERKAVRALWNRQRKTEAA